MDEIVADLKQKLAQTRNELKNIRDQQRSLKRAFTQDKTKILDRLNVKLFAENPQEVTQPSEHPITRNQTSDKSDLESDVFPFEPVSYISSMYKSKNGTPRQPGICDTSTVKLTISHKLFTNPEHSLQGLEEYSHIWVMFVFHKNNNSFRGSKVKPPRLNGAKVGLFATRSPYRPNPIGLTLARIKRIEGNVVYLVGTDMIDGTPVLDIKPYIPEYDSTCKCLTASSAVNNVTSIKGFNCETTDNRREGMDEDRSNVLQWRVLDMYQWRHLAYYLFLFVSWNMNENMGADLKEEEIFGPTQNEDIIEPAMNEEYGMDQALKEEEKSSSTKNMDFSYNEDSHIESTTPDVEPALQTIVSVADWVRTPPIEKLKVRFTSFADEQLSRFTANDDRFRLEHLKDCSDLRKAVIDILSADPRSVYRRKHCPNQLYYFSIDSVHLTCWFDGATVEVVKVQPAGDVAKKYS